jgi:hypothetical protein
VILAEIGDGRLAAGGDQLLGDAEADAAGTSGDEGNSVLKILHQ